MGQLRGSIAFSYRAGAVRMPTTILICVQIIGLFPDAADAESYAEDHSLKDWWVARLISPDAFADRHWKRLRAAHIGLGDRARDD